MAQLVEITDGEAPRRLIELAAAWRDLGLGYRAADCLERVLAVAPADPAAHDALERFYRSNAEWPALVELLGRRMLHVGEAQRAELLGELGRLYERELGDDAGALDAYREADRLVPDQLDAIDALARLELRAGDSDGAALLTLERLARLIDAPAARATVLTRAADLARLYDYDKAQAMYQRARADDPDLAAAVDGLAGLLRDLGELAQVIELLVEAADRPALADARSRWLADAADYGVAIGDTERAKQLYREARAADPGNHRAGLALIELCWDTGDLADLAPMLDDLCRTTAEPGRLRGYLVQRAQLATALGDAETAREALRRAVELDPHDPVIRRELADRLFEHGDWRAARTVIEGLLDDREDLLQPEVSIELHYRVARCAQQLGELASAARHAAVALALAPDHRPALELRAELDLANPEAQLADQLALANLAPPEEKGARFSDLGDRYAELGDRATAREMYREALAHRPDDHLLLTRFLGLVADQGDWSYSLDLVQRLVDTEDDPKVRARYRHLAAMIARDELGRADQAAALFGQAIEDDPQLFTAADELEALLTASADREAQLAFYYRRLEHVRHDEGRGGERLRLWDLLGELCVALGRRDDAVAAFEVALTLDGENPARRPRLADLYVDADPRHATAAIALHHAVLQTHRRRVASYQALRTLYRRTSQPDKARACDQAIDVMGMHVIDDKFEMLFKPRAARDRSGGAIRALTDDDWLTLGAGGGDPQISALLAVVAPAFVAERARTRPPAPARELPGEVPARLVRALHHVAALFQMTCPPAFVDPDQPAACALTMRAQAGVLAPALVFGAVALGQPLDPAELAFLLARELADLRSDRLARLLCPRPGELAQILDVAIAPDGSSHAGRWLAAALHAVDYERVLAIAGRLRDRGIDPARAARDWWTQTDRAADRIGLVITGDLAACVRMLERTTAADVDRIIELVWSSVTENVLGVRARIERWSARPGAT
jgi:tetratricopeptide (TPR) repeat protein